MIRTRVQASWGFLLAGAAALTCVGFQLLAHESHGSIPTRLANVDHPRLFSQNQIDTRNLRALRIGTWNIDRGGNWGRITNALHTLELDLALLQEVDWNDNRSGHLDETAELARSFHLNASFGIEFEELGQEKLSNQQAYIGQATLTRLPIKGTRVLRFASQTKFWQPHYWLPSHLPFMQRREGGRIALVTELEFAGQPLVVYNVHLESRSIGTLQWHQIDEVLADLKQHYDPNTPCILGGDLNTKYLPSLFLHHLQNAGFRSVTGSKIERSHVIVMALDWLFVRGNLVIEDGRVDRHIRASDHYPVIARLQAH